MLDVLGIKDAQKLVPMDTDQKPTDPVSENQNVLSGKPVKAFISQDHKAHIMVHMSAMQDPKILALLQQNPMAQQMQASMAAHISEHLGFEYRRQIEEQLGMELPPQVDESGEETPMSPEVETRLAPLLAQAAKQLLQKNQAEAQQEQAQKQAQDPLVQMQQQELQLKAQDLQRKAAKDQADAALKASQQQIERDRILSQQSTEDKRIQSKQELEDKRIRMDLLKTSAQMQNDKQGHMMDLGVDVLKQLSNKSQEEQLRMMQERIQMRQRKKEGE